MVTRVRPNTVQFSRCHQTGPTSHAVGLDYFSHTSVAVVGFTEVGVGNTSGGLSIGSYYFFLGSVSRSRHHVCETVAAVIVGRL